MISTPQLTERQRSRASGALFRQVRSFRTRVRLAERCARGAYFVKFGLFVLLSNPWEVL
jgi:hypothetical protein